MGNPSEKINCEICGGNLLFFLNKEEYPIYKCELCGLIMVYPQPTEGFLKEKVYSFESGYQGNKTGDLSTVKENKRTKKILDYFGRNTAGVKILDVGCSNGEFLYQAKKRGFLTYGVELNPRTAEIAKKNGLDVKVGTLQDANFQENFFDIIYLGDVIEHVLSPKNFIIECKKILKKRGKIIISTPNMDSLWAKITILFYRLFGIPPSSITPPHHTFQFSINNLGLLTKQQDFTFLSMWFHNPPRLMYELGSTHLIRYYKNDKKLRHLFFAVFAFTLYTLSYVFLICTSFLRRKDFGMVGVYQKNA